MTTTEKRVAWGKLIHVFIKAGWNPPPPSSQAVERIAEDIKRITVNRSWGARDATATLALAPSHLRALILAAQGLTEKEAAMSAGVSYATMKTQVKAACQRLGARNKPHAIAIAARSGLIDVAEQERPAA